MSTPTTALESSVQRNILIVNADHREVFESRFRQRVQERAYELFEGDGRADGKHDEHWLRAEAEVLQFAPPVRESGSWSTANAILQNTDPHDVQVLVLDDQAIVAIERASGETADGAAANADGSSGSGESRSASYLLIRWPVHVDPATAAAYMKGNALVVTAKHAATTGATVATAGTNG